MALWNASPRELGPGTKAVATGGQGELIADALAAVKIYDEDLTLEGLRLIWERNRRSERDENYFNYFTEVEDHFSAPAEPDCFCVPLDWALIEAWKSAGIPLEAVLRGIDQAFEKWRSRPAARTHPYGELAGLLRPGHRRRGAGHGGRRTYREIHQIPAAFLAR